MANGTIFVEFKEEVLPKIIPAVVDEYWYPKTEEEGENTEEDAEPSEDGE